jgi:membrane protease YdiL (CAAX protease family)
MGPDTITMPRWPGPLLIIGGAILAVGAVGAVGAVDAGQLDVPRDSLGWVALVGALAFVAGIVYAAVRQIRIRRVLPPSRYRGPSVILLLALVLVVVTLLTTPFGADATALLDGVGELSDLGAIVLLLSTQVALLLVAWLFVFRPNALAGLPSFPGKEPMRAVASGIGLGIVAWFVTTLLLNGVAMLMEAVGLEPEPQAAEQALGLLDPWLVVLAIVILAPIAEELFFRGVVYNAWLREGGPRWALIGSAILFAVIHLSLVTLLPIFVLGLALAWLYRRSGTLLAPIAMHMTVNGITVVLALLVRFEVIRLPV